MDKTIVTLLFVDENNKDQEIEIVHSEDFWIHVLSDLDNIALIEDQIAALADKKLEVYELSIVAYDSATANPGVHLPARIVKVCGRHNLSIDVDFYLYSLP